MLDTKEEIAFRCIPTREVYNSDNFKVYGCEVDTSLYPSICLSEYGTCSIVGNFQRLTLYKEYIVWANEKSDKKGISYLVKNITREVPNTLEESKMFLSEFISENKVNTLLKAYPDIIRKVISGDLSDIDLSTTKGIKEKTFEKIKRKIADNFVFSELITEFKGVLSLLTIKKLYEQYGSVKELKDEMRKDPYKCLCRVDGIGFKKADMLLLQMCENEEETKERTGISFDFDLRTSKQRLCACTEYVLAQNEVGGNTYMDVKSLKNTCKEMCPEAMEYFDDVLKENSIKYDERNDRVFRAYTYETEEYVAKRLMAGNYIKTIWNCDYNKYTSLNGNPLTEQQCLTTKYICENNIVILNGFGGSGKSFSTKALINMLKDYNKTFLLLAPTGRAAKVLSAYTGIEAMTIHRGLGFVPPNQWSYNFENQLDCDLVIVDEFSMVDIFLFKKLLNAIDFEKTKLLLIGDDAQLPSVGAGNILYDMLYSGIFPTITLDKIFRYGIGGLSTIATNTRLGKRYLNDKDKIQVFGEDKAYAFANVSQENIVNYAVNIYTKLLKHGCRPEEIIVLSAYNVGSYGTDVINKKIQDIVNPNADRYIEYNNTQYRLNDIVMNTSNNYKAVKYEIGMTSKYDNEYEEEEGIGQEYEFVANGEIGKIIKVFENAIVVDFDGLKIILEREDLNNIKLGYAISVHKSQGGSFKYVILLTPRAHTFNTNSNLLYVGISRAKKRCYHIGEIQTINMALRKRENFDRKTILKDFLKYGGNL